MDKKSPRWFDAVRQTTKTLMAIPSVSPSPEAENRCAERIAELLAAGRESLQPIFWNTPDGRKNVACLLKSRYPQNTGKTVILMSHFDTVGVDDFARFGDASIAFDPDRLALEIKTRLDAKSKLGELDDSERSALRSLDSGDWTFGRGSLDMKSGVAINIEIMREFARVREDGSRLIDDLAGNLLFLSCPDEETESAGILSAVPELLRLRVKEILDYLGVVNTDYTSPRDADENACYIYSGTVGKLLPSFYILGVRTHVGEIYRGVDASHLAAELVTRLNLSPAWMDTWEGTLGGESVSEVAVPPVALRMRDLKPTYNVETAGDAFVYANWLTLTITPESAMQKMKDVALEALDAVSNMIDASFEDFVALGGQSQPPPTRTGQVLDYQTLFQEAKSKWEALNANGDFPSWLAANISDFAASASDSRELSRLLVAELARLAQLSGPAIVTFFSPPFYPSVPTQENALTQAVKSALEESGEAIQFRPFYPYISDLSYVQLKDGVQIDSLKRNMPLFDAKDAHGELIYPLGSEKLNRIRELNCPVVNIGPFGRDAHGLYERVHAPYSFEVVPQIIFDTIWKVLM